LFKLSLSFLSHNKTIMFLSRGQLNHNRYGIMSDRRNPSKGGRNKLRFPLVGADSFIS